MATEIVTLKVNEHFSPEACQKSLEFFEPPPPGLQTLRWGRTVEDPNTVIWILNWTSVADHEAFTRTPIYPTFVGAVKAYCSAPIVLYHCHLQPFPPTQIFEAGLIELAAVAKKPDVSHDQFAAACGKILDHATRARGFHSAFHGIKHEDTDVHILLFGWDSVASHIAFSEREDAKAIRTAAEDMTVPQKSSVCLVKLQPH